MFIFLYTSGQIFSKTFSHNKVCYLKLLMFKNKESAAFRHDHIEKVFLFSIICYVDDNGRVNVLDIPFCSLMETIDSILNFKNTICHLKMYAHF